MKINASKHLLFYLLILTNIFADESFITQEEYGKKLYMDPRGIGCHHCHGEKGEGKIIATYREKKKNKQLSAPRINNLSYWDFQQPFKKNNSSKNVMPAYHLTEMEIQALFKYLQSFGKAEN